MEYFSRDKLTKEIVVIFVDDILSIKDGKEKLRIREEILYHSFIESCFFELEKNNRSNTMSDDVETKHRIYSERQPVIKKIRVVMSGDEAVKVCGEEYLPRLNGYTDEMYKRYLQNSVLFGAAGRTLHNATGLVLLIATGVPLASTGIPP